MTEEQSLYRALTEIKSMAEEKDRLTQCICKREVCQTGFPSDSLNKISAAWLWNTPCSLSYGHSMSSEKSSESGPVRLGMLTTIDALSIAW